MRAAISLIWILWLVSTGVANAQTFEYFGEFGRHTLGADESRLASLRHRRAAVADRVLKPCLCSALHALTGIHSHARYVGSLTMGRIVPWVRKMDAHLRAIAGPDALSLWSNVPTYVKELTTRAQFVVQKGEHTGRPFLSLTMRPGRGCDYAEPSGSPAVPAMP